MKRKFSVVNVLAGSVLGTAGLAQGISSPNVVLVMTDDQGYGDLSCHGNPWLKTPNLDRLYKESVRLNNYHVSPTCAPTRAALMTGRYSNRTGVWHTINGRSILRKNETTLAELFRQAGYRTGLFGKWHLGDNYPSRPEDKGFNEVFRHGGGGMGQTPDYWDNAYFDNTYIHNGKPETVNGFCTDVFFDQAMNFIKTESENKRPFFTYLVPNAAHSPMHCPPNFSAPYKDLGVSVANFYGMIANIDWNMGRLETFLRENGLAGNTILIFTTDNGSAAGWKLYNSGMRAGKASAYDGGHRVPFFIRWPDGGLGGGREVAQLASHIDIAPTLSDLLKLPVSNRVRFDGISLVPLLKGEGADWPDRVVITDSQRIHMPDKWRESSIMTDRWRLINGNELYDIKMDPGQRKDIASKYPETVARLRADYEIWWNSMAESFSDDCEIVLGNDAENPTVLTAHDWMIAEGYAPWNQQLIRNQGLTQEGEWAVEIDQAGLYRIKLSRWPPETARPIRAALLPGKPVPGESAYRTVPGESFPAVKAVVDISGQHAETDVFEDSICTVFELSLPAGTTRLHGAFLAEDGSRLGSYYAIVERLRYRD
jgi:arylsulfatase B